MRRSTCMLVVAISAVIACSPKTSQLSQRLDEETEDAGDGSGAEDARTSPCGATRCNDDTEYCCDLQTGQGIDSRCVPLDTQCCGSAGITCGPGLQCCISPEIDPATGKASGQCISTSQTCCQNGNEMIVCEGEEQCCRSSDRPGQPGTGACVPLGAECCTQGHLEEPFWSEYLGYCSGGKCCGGTGYICIAAEDSCCEWGDDTNAYYACANGSTCCDSSDSGCCPQGYTCCEPSADGCIPSDWRCCADRPDGCPADQECCGASCCPAGTQSCVDDVGTCTACLPPGVVKCEGDNSCAGVCGAGESCCIGVENTPTGQRDVLDDCCTPSEMCKHTDLGNGEWNAECVPAPIALPWWSEEPTNDVLAPAPLTQQ